MVFISHSFNLNSDTSIETMLENRQEIDNFLGSFFGFKIRGNTLEVEPFEAQLIKEIFILFIEGHSPFDIALELNTMNLRTRKNQPWSIEDIKEILTNPIYIGWLTCSHGDSESCFLIEDTHQGIIELNLWERARIYLLLTRSA